jgi:hypothetical protein
MRNCRLNLAAVGVALLPPDHQQGNLPEQARFNMIVEDCVPLWRKASSWHCIRCDTSKQGKTS